MPDASNPFVAGGTVPPSGAFYIERAADRELLDACRSGTLAYLLGSRQTGKSSLLARAWEQLNKENVLCSFVDLTTIVSADATEVFRGVLDRIAYDLDVAVPDRKLEALATAPADTVLREFFDTIILPRRESKIEVFIDEFDLGLESGFTQTLLASVSSLYFARKASPKFRRVGFVLSGAAIPESLSIGYNTGVFHIGVSIDPRDFTTEDIKAAAPFFSVPRETAEAALVRVHEWTGGQPYLTMKLCRMLLRDHRSDCTPAAVDEMVDSILLARPDYDSNLQFVAGMLRARGPEVLDTYKKILKGGKVIYEPVDVKDWLRLSGVVRIADGLLEVRNQIYRTVFNEEWIDRQSSSMDRPSILRRLFKGTPL